MAAIAGTPDASVRTIAAAAAPLTAATLKVAYDCALLSKLAYYNPRAVEELRQKANQEQSTAPLQLRQDEPKVNDSGTVVVPPSFKDTKDENDLKVDPNAADYLTILRQFKNKTDCHYFDAQALSPHSKQSSQAYFFFSETPSATQKNVLYVAFRGTETEGESGGDVKADLDFDFVEAKPKFLIQKDSWGPDYKGEPMKLHQGFLNQFEVLAEAIDSNAEAAVKRMKDQIDALKDRSAANGGIEVIVTGHSLGAALATIGSFVAAAKHPGLKISCYNFGSPRVGNKAFADYYQALMSKPQAPGEVYRFANKDDPVPHVPTPPGYHHVAGGGYQLETGKDGTVSTVPLPAEHWVSFDLHQYRALAHEAAAWFERHVPGFTFTKNHSMDLYAAHIMELRKKAEGKTSV